MSKVLVVTALFSSAFLNSGCATSFALGLGEGKQAQRTCDEGYVYAGTLVISGLIYHGLGVIFYGGEQAPVSSGVSNVLSGVLDYPFSFLLDTLALPVTIPLTITCDPGAGQQDQGKQQ